jgi:alpha/beta superfamily hydrolase
VHGERDDVVPLAAVFDWARPQALPVTVLPGAGHFFHGQLTALKHIVCAPLARTRLPAES